MKTWKQTMMAAAVLAGLGVTAQAADEAQKSGAQQSSAQTDAAGSAQQAGDKQKAGQQQGAMSPDGMFVKHAAIAGMKEVKLAEIAMQKSSNEEVKKIAQHIQTDHQQANDQLKPIAQKLGVEIPAELPKEKQEVVQYFESLEGEQFDQEYLSAMKAAHAYDISKFQDKAQVAQNPELKQWAAQCLPKLQQHQQHVMAAAPQAGLPAGGNDAAAAGHSSDTAQPAGQRLDGSSSRGQQGDAGTAGTTSGGSSSSSTSGGAGGASGARGSSSGASGAGGSSGAGGASSGGSAGTGGSSGGSR